MRIKDPIIIMMVCRASVYITAASPPEKKHDVSKVFVLEIIESNLSTRENIILSLVAVLLQS